MGTLSTERQSKQMSKKKQQPSSKNLLTKYETTQGYCQPAAGQFSQWKSFMFIKNANQRVPGGFIARHLPRFWVQH